MKINNTIIDVIHQASEDSKCDAIVSQMKSDAVDQDSVRQEAAVALKHAHEVGAKSIAFPALGCMTGFNEVGSAKIIVQEIFKFLKSNKTTIKEIKFCIADQGVFEVFNETVQGYIKHIQENLGPGPYVTVDVIIELDDGIILIERSNPPYGWALPGGFLDYGESLEEAANREAKEETNLDLEGLKQFHTYSQPDRDPRFHTISTVFTAKGIGKPQFGDDAKGLKIVPYDDLLSLEYAFDHHEIIEEYLEKKNV